MAVRRYSTSFPLTENPIAEAGMWINGGTTGLDWTNARSTPGKIFGTQPGNSVNIYDDSVACLTGSWSNDQAAEATVYVTSGPVSCCGEVELVLHNAITGHVDSGYEFTFGVQPGSPYWGITRLPGFKGAVPGDFTDLGSTGSGVGVVNGDVFGATSVNGLLTMYVNGLVVKSAYDTTWTGGSPGLGFFLSNNPGTIGNWGFTKYAANDAGVLPSKLPISSRFTIGRGGSG
jgi:hypothetical protein